MAKLATKINIRLARPSGDKRDGRAVSVYLDNEDVSWKIRELEIGEGASQVAIYPAVRKVLVNLQQQMCVGKRVVMEGRDIGSKVLPQADLKIFMVADQTERVKRKQKQLKQVGEQVTKKQVQADLVSRDTREMTREVDPLAPTLDAWQLDTTEMNINQVVEVIVDKVSSLSKIKPVNSRKGICLSLFKLPLMAQLRLVVALLPGCCLKGWEFYMLIRARCIEP